ncbi:malonate decarboxylase holo-[acyl-carrier-protein] synthase [Ancylobacter pratisalsi]|uniref:Malonate decarboxylase holo-[acyl-carrier-protein] synthase n=1 Tax=Ancylobacter pratisalsi TaxID=1745854 RepID=A0A6P1YI78_9HYPH|nr:malonate decarboxylase holo-[acyl-carrier-protein] synthase [Ancylobacter pratisalsi]QIB32979.1 malonate decarboxylase holo-[acyl-carrier-protein] synthase [Ancylobacter pratisalsi]
MFARHDLVWLDPDALPVLEVPGDMREHVDCWIHTGHPAVVRRDDTLRGEVPTVALGIPLPQRLGRRRLVLQAPLDAIVRRGRFPSIAAATSAAPESMREVLAETTLLLEACGAHARVYGSLGWQHLTGEIYLHPASDIDLLIEPDLRFDIDAALDVFRTMAMDASPRLDGELVVAPDRALAWRELLTSPGEVLLRGRDTLILVASAPLLAGLRREPVA